MNGFRNICLNLALDSNTRHPFLPGKMAEKKYNEEENMKFYHCNHSVTDLEKSIEFYKVQFGLNVQREISAYGGDLRLAFLGSGESDFLLELTWYRNHPHPYDLGEKEFHVAFSTNQYEDCISKHKEAGIMVQEDPENRLYFVTDPDGYLIEIVEKL